MFTEGWVEFCNKKIAKHVAESLNTTRISMCILSIVLCRSMCIYINQYQPTINIILVILLSIQIVTCTYPSVVY